MSTVVIVTGDRNAEEAVWRPVVERVLAEIDPDLVIHGACRGIDRIAQSVCTARHVATQPFPYPGHLGRAGGPVRNRQMLARLLQVRSDEYAEIAVLAFHPGLGHSKGTLDMVRQAARAGVRVTWHRPERDPVAIVEDRIGNARALVYVPFSGTFDSSSS